LAKISPTSTASPAGRHRAAGRALDHLFAALPALWLLGVFIIPLGFTVVFSFGRSSFGGIKLDFTLDNYAQALSGFYLDSFLRTIQFGSDGSFSWEHLSAVYTSELANGLGNLASRIAAMVGKYFDGALPEPTDHGSYRVTRRFWLSMRPLKSP